MKQFFYILFGGLSAVACGIGFAYGGVIAWRAVSPSLGFHSDFSFSRAISAVAEEASANTFISGLKRTVRFSAHEEEDASNVISQSAPLASNGVITANTYIVKNLTEGTIFMGHDEDRSVPVASLTKLVTAAVARRLIRADQRITITDDIISAYGNTAGFKKGETFRADDLLYPLLMVSSNDAAEAFARDYGRAQFIKAMNDFAQEIGAYRTYFVDPSGLSAHNISSANDLALIIDWIRTHDPEIIKITGMKAKTVRSHTWVNPTHFLSWSHYLGGKNGYTPEAERTALSLFEMGDGKEVYAVVVLGSLSRDTDVMNLLGKVEN